MCVLKGPSNSATFAILLTQWEFQTKITWFPLIIRKYFAVTFCHKQPNRSSIFWHRLHVRHGRQTTQITTRLFWLLLMADQRTAYKRSKSRARADRIPLCWSKEVWNCDTGVTHSSVTWLSTAGAMVTVFSGRWWWSLCSSSVSLCYFAGHPRLV